MSLSRSDRLRNKSAIFANYRIEFKNEGDDVVRERYFNAKSEQHAQEMFQEILKRQNVQAEILSIKVE